MKKLVLAMTMLALLGVGPVFAEGDGTGRFEERKDDIKGKIEDRRENKSASVALTADQMICIKTAITKREDALIAGHDAYALAIKNAYMARKTALLAAWDKTDRAERRAAVKAADRAFQQAVKAARMAWNTVRRGAWKTFETDRKACVPGAQVSSSETGTAQNDVSL